MSGLVRESSCKSGLTVVVVLSTWESSRRGGGRVAARLESTSYWCTYQRHCGNAGTQVTGGRTSGIVECWGRTRAGNPGGRPSQGTAGSIPRTGGHRPKDWQALFFNKKRLNDSCVRVRMGVPFWFGGLVFLHLLMHSWLFSLILLRFGLVFLRFLKLSFSVQSDSNTRGRTTPTGALQCHYVGQALQGSALPLLARFPCPLVREFGGNLQRHLACIQKVVSSLSCTSLSFLGFPMEGCPLFEGRLSDESLRRWRYGFQRRCKVAHFRPFHHFGVSYAGVLTRSGCGCCGMSLSSHLRDASRQEFPQFLNVATICPSFSSPNVLSKSLFLRWATSFTLMR